MTTTQTFTRLAPALPFVKQMFHTGCVVRRSLRQSAADTPLAQWLVEYGESRGWTAGRQAAKYLGVKQAAFSTWLRGEVEPSREYQEQLATATGQPLAFIVDLVRRTKALKYSADTAAPLPERREWSPSGDDIYEVIRLTAEHAATSAVQKAVEEMSRRRPPVDPDPESNPVLAEVMSRLYAQLVLSTDEGIAEAERCVLEAVQRHRRSEGQRLQARE